MKLVFDIGGTTTRLGISSNSSQIDEIATYPTPQNYDEGLTSLKEHGLRLSRGEEITEVSGGIAGGLNAGKDSLQHGGNIPDWVNKPIKTDFQKLFNATKVVIENDTAVAALGESVFGAGRNYGSVMYIAVGTGIGGAWVVNKTLNNSPYGFEPGHQIIDFQNKLSLQDLVSGKALSITFGHPAAEITSEELWEEIAQPLVVGLTNSFLHWPSEIIILGGGVILGHTFPLAELREALSERMPSISPFPKIVTSELGDYPALYGALTL